MIDGKEPATNVMPIPAPEVTYTDALPSGASVELTTTTLTEPVFAEPAFPQPEPAFAEPELESERELATVRMSAPEPRTEPMLVEPPTQAPVETGRPAATGIIWPGLTAAGLP